MLFGVTSYQCLVGCVHSCVPGFDLGYDSHFGKVFGFRGSPFPCSDPLQIRCKVAAFSSECPHLLYERFGVVVTPPPPRPPPPQHTATTIAIMIKATHSEKACHYQYFCSLAIGGVDVGGRGGGCMGEGLFVHR